MSQDNVGNNQGINKMSSWPTYPGHDGVNVGNPGFPPPHHDPNYPPPHFQPPHDGVQVEQFPPGHHYPPHQGGYPPHFPPPNQPPEHGYPPHGHWNQPPTAFN